MADGGALPRSRSGAWRRITASATIGGETYAFSAFVTGEAELRIEPVLLVTRPLWRRILGIPSKATVSVQPRVIARESGIRFTLPLLVKGRFDG